MGWSFQELSRSSRGILVLPMTPDSEHNRLRAGIVSFLNQCARTVELYPKSVIGGLWLLCAAIALHASHGKFLWHDELFTYYMASAPTLRQMMGEVANIDLNPPLSYLLVRASLHLPGSRDVLVRLPSFVAYCVAWTTIFFLVRRFSNAVWGLAAVLLCWNTWSLTYAWEARPYAVLLASAVMLLWFWVKACEPGRPWWAVLGLLGAGSALFLSHMLAIFAMFAMMVAEAVRSYRRRRIDVPLWLGLAMPCGIFLYYFHISTRYAKNVYPSAALVRPGSIPHFYFDIMDRYATALVAFLVIAMLLRLGKEADRGEKKWPQIEEYVAWIGLAAVPAMCLAAFYVRHMPMAERYGIIGTLGFTLCFIYALVRAFRTSPSAGAAACTALVLFLPVSLSRNIKLSAPASKAGFVRSGDTIGGLAPSEGQLPVVVAHGDTFLDMNDREDPKFMGRIFFLRSRADAIRYAELSLFDDEIGAIDGVFPLHGHVANFYDFTAAHRHFLLISTPPSDPANWEGWVMPKLLAQGAEVRLLGRDSGGYLDPWVFDVTMP